MLLCFGSSHLMYCMFGRYLCCYKIGIRGVSMVRRGKWKCLGSIGLLCCIICISILKSSLNTMLGYTECTFMGLLSKCCKIVRNKIMINYINNKFVHPSNNSNIQEVQYYNVDKIAPEQSIPTDKMYTNIHLKQNQRYKLYKAHLNQYKANK